MDINSRDPDGYTPGDVIERIIRTVNEGTYGIDYTIRPGNKEQKLRDDYIVDDKKIADILCSLLFLYMNMDYSISIPRKLQKPGRKYEVVCVARDGRAVLLPTTMNGEDRLTFSTLYLYAFGLMYKD